MDWKDALRQLAQENGSQENEEKQETSTSIPIDKKKRKGIVYSTNPDYTYSAEDETEVDTLPPNQQKLRVYIERKGRAGKTVTIIKGFVGIKQDLNSLGTQIKQQLGVGGSIKDGEIIIQGSHKEKIEEILRKIGYK